MAADLNLTLNGTPVPVYLGENTTLANNAAQQAAASEAVALAAAGPNYANTAAGLAATSEGDTFAVDNGDETITVYSHDAGPVATALRTFPKDILALLAATATGKGDALVGAAKTFTNQYLQTLSQIRYGDDVSFLRWVDPDEHSNILDGTSTFDAETVLQNALDDLSDETGSGATLRLPYGLINIADEIAVPSGVNLIGHGGAAANTGIDAATILKATNAAACLSFGGRASANANYGGVSGGFQLDGNALSKRMLYYGRVLGRTLKDFSVVGCALEADNAAFVIEEAQNNDFQSFYIGDNSGTGLLVRGGAARQTFLGFEFNKNAISGGYHAHFTADYDPADLTPYATNLQFIAGIFERDGGAMDAGIYHEAGSDVRFAFTNLACSESDGTSEFPYVQMLDNGFTDSQSVRMVFDHTCHFNGSQTASTLFDIDDSCDIHLYGSQRIDSFLNFIRLNSTSARLYRHGYSGIPAPSNITNELASDSHVSATIAAQVLTVLSKLRMTGDLTALGNVDIQSTAGLSKLIVRNASAQGLFRINTTNGNLELANACDLLIYSGNFATQVFRVDGATGAATFALAALPNHADDTAAASGGVAVGQLYRNGSIVMVRAA